jgi:hypothetical protein
MMNGTNTVAPGFEGYIGDMLSTGWGLAKLPYQPFTGERFAPTTPLQQQAFTGYQGLGAYQPGQFSAGFDYQPGQFNTGLGPVGSVQDYMNPFMQGVVDVQAREARRQADIGRQAEQARLAQAGAYGGSRQAIMEAERQRNLGTQIGDIQAKGLMTAYEQAQKQRLGEATLGLEGQRLGEMSRQFGAEGGAKFGLEAQRLGEASRQFGAEQGLKTLADQLKAGTVQRGIAQEPLDFGYKEFTESLNWPYKGLATMQSLLEGMPVKANPYEPGSSGFASGVQGGLLAGGLYDIFFGKK